MMIGMKAMARMDGDLMINGDICHMMRKRYDDFIVMITVRDECAIYFGPE